MSVQSKKCQVRFLGVFIFSLQGQGEAFFFFLMKVEEFMAVVVGSRSIVEVSMQFNKLGELIFEHADK